MTDQVHAQERAHPTTGTYLAVAAVLTVITLVELGVFYIPAFRPVLAPVLLVLSAGKFCLVVMFYMHLKQDHRLFAAILSAPLREATVLIVALMFLFGSWWLA
jgi:cytochrome c oxidase subunit 4